MEKKKLYQSVGLPLGTWELVNQAQTSRVIREVLGRYPSLSDLIDLMLRYGSAYLTQLEEKEQAFLEEKLR